MKSDGYRRVTLWDLPSPADKRMAAQGYRQVPAWETPPESKEKNRAVKAKVAVQINEGTLNATARQPEIKEAIKRAAGAFLHELGGSELSKDKLAVYEDFMELIKLIGDPWADN
jgi:hypothetical protein